MCRHRSANHCKYRGPARQARGEPGPAIHSSASTSARTPVAADDGRTCASGRRARVNTAASWLGRPRLRNLPPTAQARQRRADDHVVSVHGGRGQAVVAPLAVGAVEVDSRQPGGRDMAELYTVSTPSPSQHRPTRPSFPSRPSRAAGCSAVLRPSGRRPSGRRPSRPQDHKPAARSLDVVVEVELPRVGTETDGVDLVLALVGDPCLDQVVGENPAGLEELMVRFQGGQGFLERAGHLRH